MNEGKIMLLMQLIELLNTTFYNFEKAYNENDKEKFERFKRALIETQKKIDFVINQK